MSELQALEVLRSAGNCNDCFQSIPGMKRAAVNMPKPRWIGERYWVSVPRIVIVLINPGAGKTLGEDFHKRERDLFSKFYFTGDYGPIRTYFRGRFQQELSGQTRAKPVFSWYYSTFGLEFEDIAQVNIAWCASENDQYPGQMLAACFRKHTHHLLQSLEPHAVLLSGSKTHRFRAILEKSAPGVRVIETIHYSSRKSHADETAEGARIRTELQRLRSEIQMKRSNP